MGVFISEMNKTSDAFYAWTILTEICDGSFQKKWYTTFKR